MPTLFGRIHLDNEEHLDCTFVLSRDHYLLGRDSRLLDEQSRVLFALFDGDGDSRGDTTGPGLQSPLLDYFSERSHLEHVFSTVDETLSRFNSPLYTFR